MEERPPVPTAPFRFFAAVKGSFCSEQSGTTALARLLEREIALPLWLLLLARRSVIGTALCEGPGPGVKLGRPMLSRPFRDEAAKGLPSSSSQSVPRLTAEDRVLSRLGGSVDRPCRSVPLTVLLPLRL